MHLLASEPNWYQILEQMIKGPWCCTTTDLDNSIELQTVKIRPVDSELPVGRATGLKWKSPESRWWCGLNNSSYVVFFVKFPIYPGNSSVSHSFFPISEHPKNIYQLISRTTNWQLYSNISQILLLYKVWGIKMNLTLWNPYGVITDMYAMLWVCGTWIRIFLCKKHTLCTWVLVLDPTPREKHRWRLHSLHHWQGKSSNNEHIFITILRFSHVEENTCCSTSLEKSTDNYLRHFIHTKKHIMTANFHQWQNNSGNYIICQL